MSEGREGGREGVRVLREGEVGKEEMREGELQTRLDTLLFTCTVVAAVFTTHVNTLIIHACPTHVHSVYECY